MAAAKTPRRISPTTLAVAGEPVGEWAKVLAETVEKGKDVKPFRVTENLVIYPPTPERAKQMSVATMAVNVAVAAAALAIRTGATPEEVNEIQKQIDAGDLAYTEGLLGKENVPLVDAFFKDRGDWEKTTFIDAVKKQFLQLPDDDKCQACGRSLDEDAAGKGQESSTTSSTTGVSSRVTSPQSSTE